MCVKMAVCFFSTHLPFIIGSLICLSPLFPILYVTGQKDLRRRDRGDRRRWPRGSIDRPEPDLRHIFLSS